MTNFASSVTVSAVSGTDRRRRAKRTTQAVALALAAAVSLSACQTTGAGTRGSGGSGGSGATQTSASVRPGSPEAQLAARNDNYNSILAQGCVVGTVVGGILGLVIGGDAQSAGIGAGLGAGLGCAGGYALAEQNMSRAEEEEVLNNRIEAANKAVADYEQEMRLTNQIVDKETTEIKRLRSQISRGQASRADASRQLVQTNESIDIIRENLENNRDRLAKMGSDRQAMAKAGLSTRDISQKEARMRALLRQQEAALNKLINERDALV